MATLNPKYCLHHQIIFSKQAKSNWSKEYQKAFGTIKKLMLSHPNFDKPFEIHTDTSKLQLGSFISQNDKHIAFYSRTHNSAQVYCTTTEHDVISIELEKNLEL